MAIPIKRQFPRKPLVLGPMPAPSYDDPDNPWQDFVRGDYPAGAMTVVMDPTGSGRKVIRNVNTKAQASTDKHSTVGTGRSLPKGSTHYIAFEFLFLNAAEFGPTSGWNLIAQCQMIDSPTYAISVRPSTDPAKRRLFLKARNGADAGKDYDLGPLLYNRWGYYVVGARLADGTGGKVECWARYDDWPDVTKHNVAGQQSYASRSGQDTWQGEVGHNTIGLYADHGSGPGTYAVYFCRFARETTAAGALAIARSLPRGG